MASTATAPRHVRAFPVQGMPLGRWVRTTPGRLRVASVVLLAGLLVVGIVAASAASARSNAAHAVGETAVPELVAAQNLYVALADADATASKIFLTPGDEPVDLRERYHRDIRDAGRYLAQARDAAGSSATVRDAAATIAAQLAVYAEGIGTARANLGQGNTVGAAYQRAASSLMREKILPAATAIYTHAANELDDTYGSGTSTSEIVFVLVAGVLLLAVLVGVQLFAAHRTKRILNVGLVGATVLVLVLLGWTVVRFTSEQDALVRAQQHGSDEMEVLSSARILTLRAQSDEQLALAERSTTSSYVTDFDTFSARLGGTDGTGGLLGNPRTLAARTGSEAHVDALADDFARFMTLHNDVREKDENGSYNDAVGLAIGDEAQVVAQLDAGLSDEIARAERRLDDGAADARGGFGALAVGIPLLAVLAAVLVLVGLQRRIGEYR